MAIRKIEKSEIDFNKVYGNQKDAMAQNGNTVKVNEIYWGDNGDLYYNEETGMVSEDGVGLGFINIDDIVSNNDLNTDNKASMYDGSFRNDSDIMKQSAKTDIKGISEEGESLDPSLESLDSGSENTGITEGAETIDNIETGEETSESTIDYSSDNGEVNMEDIVPEAADLNNNTQTPAGYKPEDFNFKHEDSNILASKAKNMGFTDEQVLIAIGISRYETGNYEHLAYGYNYGGVTGNGDLGQEGGYAKYSSKDVGMDAYLSNLKDNYFDQGLNTVESMARKYLGYDDTAHWISQVYGSMS